MKHRLGYSRAVIVAAFVLLPSCNERSGPPDAGEPAKANEKAALVDAGGRVDAVRRAKQEAEAFYLSTVKWASPNLSVCWEEMDPQFAQQRDWVREQVGLTWEHESLIRFSGWGQCGAGGANIRIHIEDGHPRAAGLGKSLDNKINGILLNFQYVSWKCAPKEFCTRVIGVHEFGHALGLAHEQNRPDTPASCKDSDQGTDGDVMIGDWDLDSVMNYCNPEYNGNGELSVTDIAAIRQIYGGPSFESNDSFYSAFGTSENKVVGQRCPTGTRRTTIDVKRKWDSGGHCEFVKWLSAEENDCRAEYHLGVPMAQTLRCGARVFTENKCNGGKSWCGGTQTCESLNTDERNCGECGRRCSGSDVCLNGRCGSPSCPSGQHECGCHPDNACMAAGTCQKCCRGEIPACAGLHLQPGLRTPPAAATATSTPPAPRTP